MQPIQDKDFDQLFKDTFENAEVTPSKNLWANIEAEIAPKQKRKLPVLWLAAAAILIFVTVGILISKQQEVAGPDSKLATNIPKAEPTVVKVPVEDAVKNIVSPIEPKKQASSKRDYLPKKKVTQAKPLDLPKVITTDKQIKQDVQLAQNNDIKPQGQDVLKQRIDAAIQQPKEEQIIASNPTAVKADEPLNDDDQSFKNIKNVGDVVNIIVNKVDKRKDKFIQFRTDDDDSSLSSINIGPFKIGKRNKK